MKKNISILIVLFLCGCVSMKNSNTDNLIWLEEVEGDKSLKWVKNQNKITDEKNENSKIFLNLETSALKILEDKNKIPYISMRGDFVYNFWQGPKHVKGIWRRTSLSSYKTKSPKWETLLDVDKLSESENENWVFKQADCLAPDYNQCLIYLSRGGKDATVTREFNIKTKSFIEDGFKLPEAKSWVSWRDKDSLYVGTDFGKDTMTKSGYPKIIKIWKRNTPLTSAKTLFTGKTDDMGAYGYFLEDGKDKFHIVTQYKSFYETKKWAIQNGNLTLLPLQDSAEIEELFKGYLIVLLKKDWTIDQTTYVNGSILAIKTSITNGKPINNDIINIMSPTPKLSIQSVKRSKNKLVISTLENVRGKIYEISYKNNGFTKPELLKLKSDGDIRLAGTSDDSDLILFYDEGFLKPRSLNLYNLDNNKITLLKSLSSKFNGKDMITEQRWSTSKDGTKIPYFIVGTKSALQNGNAPTELYGYGGFNISNKPYYNDILGKLWLEKGGVYVLANIRGGGEFGPKWHQSAILKNKHKSYEDFISVAEHLISTKVTTSEKLAISGGSNGGLLVGAVMVKRPDLFNSVVCQVPLLDMMRYHKLLAGASWMAEYGNPDDPEMKDYILTYSPYQNVKKNVQYPKVLFMTSTKDDRVHPGHARKMAARMMAQGHKGVSYYENMQGGHSASSNLKQKAKMTAIKYNFLLENLNN